MRLAALIASFLLSQALSALPVLRTALNTDVYEASASDTRCVTGYYDPTSLNTNLTHLTLWDISDPLHPRVGTTISQNNWNGWSIYRQPTIHGNLLIYLDDDHLHVLDITDVAAPQSLHVSNLGQTYCFALLGDFLVTGRQDGALELRDLSDPAYLPVLSVTQALPAVWALWASGDKLAVRCGNFSSNTAKLYSLDGDQLVETASVPAGERLRYVGEWDGKLLLQTQSGVIRVHDCSNPVEPVLLAEIPASDAFGNILASGATLAALGSDDRVRLWNLGADAQPVLAGFYDLVHLGLDPGVLCELRGKTLVFTLDTVLCFILDISDLSPDPALVSEFTSDADIRSLALAGETNTVYYARNNYLGALRLGIQGTLQPEPDIPGAGVVLRVESYKERLYTLALQGTAYRLRGMSVQPFAPPIPFLDMPLTSNEFFSLRGRTFYSGITSQIAKYHLGDGGEPQFVRQLNYAYNAGGENFTVYFYDIAPNGDADYGVGVWGNWFVGFHPVFVWWYPDGSSGCYGLGRFFDQVVSLDNYVYLLGYGVQTYRVNPARQPQFLGAVHENCLFHGFGTTHLLRDRYLFAANELTNNIYVLDLQDREAPSLLHTIRQASTSYDLAVCGNYLLSAAGPHGLRVYALPGLTDSQDELLPPPQALHAFPNPFAATLNISFSLDKAAPARLECFNLRGQLVWASTADTYAAGKHTLAWDGRDNSGRDCPAGVYLLRLSGPAGNATRRVAKLSRLP